MPYICSLCVSGGRRQYHWRPRPVVNHRKALLIWSPRLKRVKMVLTVLKNGFHSHPNAPESVDGWDSAPDPRQLGRALFALASLTRRVGNGVIAIQKWVLYTPKCSRKALAAGAPPQRPRPPCNSEGERLRRLPVWHAERTGRQFPSSPRASETLGTSLP